MRQLDQFIECLDDIFGQTDIDQVEHHPALVEQPEHHGFPVDHRDDRNPHVDLAATNPQLDPAVLGHPPFGDVQPRHDFQSRDD